MEYIYKKLHQFAMNIILVLSKNFQCAQTLTNDVQLYIVWMHLMKKKPLPSSSITLLLLCPWHTKEAEAHAIYLFLTRRLTQITNQLVQAARDDSSSTQKYGGDGDYGSARSLACQARTCATRNSWTTVAANQLKVRISCIEAEVGIPWVLLPPFLYINCKSFASSNLGWNFESQF